MLSATLTAVGARLGSFSWPNRRVRRRLRPVGIVSPSKVQRARGIRTTSILFALPVLLGAVIAGAGGACAALAATVTGRHCRRTWGEQHLRWQRWDELANGLRLLTAQLRTGAHPAAAAEGAAAETAPFVSQLFQEIATTARLGGDVGGSLAATDRTDRLRHPRLAMARAWTLSERHGAGLAELLDSVRRDLESRARFQRRVQADMAGPRSTAMVLTGLPVIGLLLGEMSGASPGSVLFNTGLGQVLLVIGVLLVCAGALWTVKLTEVSES